MRRVDGRRGYPDDEQQQRWNDDDQGAGGGGWREGGYPREAGGDRGGEPSFNGFVSGYGGPPGDPRWVGEGQPDQPSWNTSARPLPADGMRRPMDDAPPRLYAVDSAGPATGELPRSTPMEPRIPVGEPVPPPLALPDPGPGMPGDSAAGLNAPTGLMPPIAPRDETQRFPTDPLRRPGAAPGAPADGVYRTRRPGLLLAYGVLTAIFEIGALRIFFDSMFSGALVISGIVSGMFLIAGLPLLAAGLYAATTGGARAEGPGGWLRPPAVYLVVGLGLLIAAGLAAA
ncbi:hypothetical protein SAMN05421684_3936 [Asanoa ishikariensis]|uniref:Uncharacterized protein n=1 Tax=Asanoa ishikariensis TaxID=137265 RepID=A0A1H3RKS9_9ACTN|nr:hypothetical protein SAMN05421684_3936 [Asanoa ishikariensis]